MANRRSQILIDTAVQGGLVMRVLFYWFFFLLTLSLMLTAWSVFSGPPRPFAELLSLGLIHIAPACLTTFVVVPLLCVDIVRYSNRFVGPAKKIKHGLQQLSQQGHAEPIGVRKKDFWQETCDDFNRVAARYPDTNKAAIDPADAPSSLSEAEQASLV